MSTESITLEGDFIQTEQVLEEESLWNGKLVRRKKNQPEPVIETQLFHRAQFFLEPNSYRKPLGEGTYNVSVEKEPDRPAEISGSVSYEADNGTKISAEVQVNTEGGASAKVSVGGKF